MHASPLSALSPLDGRYADKLAALRPWLSEFGLMRCRVRVEVEWFIALASAGLAELAPPGPAANRVPEPPRRRLLGRRRRGDQGDRAAHQPRRQGGRVLARRALRREPTLAGATGFIHFACTSEDINNTSHALMLEAARREVLLPALDALVARLAALAQRARGAADAGANARPDGDADDARQGDRQRRGAAGARARRHRRGRDARQDERRGRQLQRPRRGVSRVRLAGVRAPRRRGSPRPGVQRPHDADRAARRDRRRCSTPSSAATRS